MDALKQKLFDVLIEKISVIQFENWLYSSNEFLNNIDSNSFYFDVISINYKSNEWVLKLNKLIAQYQYDDLLEITTIKKTCVAILNSETFKNTSELLKFSTRDFDYDTEYSILYKFYSFRSYYGLVDEGLWKIGTLDIELKFYAKQIIELIHECQDFESFKTALTLNLIPFRKEKIRYKKPLKQNIFAFLKKL